MSKPQISVQTPLNSRGQPRKKAFLGRRKRPVWQLLILYCHINTQNGCWEWMRSSTKAGYGKITVNKRTCLAHRISHEEFNGPVDGKCVLHRCDNPKCINPTHLFLGTHKENTADMVRKGRNAPILEAKRGERSNFSKLKSSDVKMIRLLYLVGVKQSCIAEDFGITDSAVSNTVNHKRWRHVV